MLVPGAAVACSSTGVRERPRLPAGPSKLPVRQQMRLSTARTVLRGSCRSGRAPGSGGCRRCRKSALRDAWPTPCTTSSIELRVETGDLADPLRACNRPPTWPRGSSTPARDVTACRRPASPRARLPGRSRCRPLASSPVGDRRQVALPARCPRTPLPSGRGVGATWLQPSHWRGPRCPSTPGRRLPSLAGLFQAHEPAVGCRPLPDPSPSEGASSASCRYRSSASRRRRTCNRRRTVRGSGRPWAPCPPPRGTDAFGPALHELPVDERRSR